MKSPLRMLQGVTYWVIDEPDPIYDYVNTNIRREWEMDIRGEGRAVEDDPWLQTLSKRHWTLETVGMDEIRLDPRIMNHRDDSRNYDFQVELAKRRAQLRRSVEYGSVIWPVIVDERMMLRDGYCRCTALAEMRVTETYCYAGRLQVGT